MCVRKQAPLLTSAAHSYQPVVEVVLRYSSFPGEATAMEMFGCCLMPHVMAAREIDHTAVVAACVCMPTTSAVYLFVSQYLWRDRRF